MRRRIEEWLSALDVLVESCESGDAHRRVVSGEHELLVMDSGNVPAAAVRSFERLLASGATIRLLLIVDQSGVAGLRLPVQASADFMVKGASAEEFLARVRGLLWPGEESSERDILHIDRLALNLATYQASLDGVPIDFTYLEYALFAFLVTHPGRTYSREALMQRVWGSDYYGGSRTVDVHVRRIRAKIGPETSRRLETVRNVGYLWRG